MMVAQAFPNFATAFQASNSELLQARLPEDLVEIFIRHRENLDLKLEALNLENSNIKLLNYKNPVYPKLLLEIPSFPPLLYIKGQMLTSEELMLAVVGTRKITNYGRTILPGLLEPLVSYGLTIVSGLAFGVDAAAHSVATKSGARTVAVLGSGLDEKSLYPKNHLMLAEEIISYGGSLISEHPPGRPALKQNFVARNRIISGLSLGTLVIECGLKSGALITARHALDQNRQVYTVPGPIYAEQSTGPNNLLKMGAKCVTQGSDILDDLNIKPIEARLPKQKDFEVTPEEQKLLEILSFEPIGVNELIKKAGLDAGAASAHLTFLEMKGKIRNLGGQQYVLARKI